MARARNIKPGFSKNEDLAECSIAARLCFALLPMLADREGRLEDRPKRIKGELFPFDALEVEPLLAELARFGFIERYAVETRGLIQIIAFHKHQHPHHKEPESVLPPPQSLRLEADGKWVKPEALPSSHEPEAPDKPEALIPTGGHASGQNREVQGGSNPADSGALIPESGFRSTDSGARSTEPVREPPGNAEGTEAVPVTTLAGRVCLAMRRAGLAGVNPGHPELLALIEAGATEAEFSGAAATAVDRGKGFGYALGVLKGQRTDAAQTKAGLHRGPLPAKRGGPPQTEAERKATNDAVNAEAMRLVAAGRGHQEAIDHA